MDGGNYPGPFCQEIDVKNIHFIEPGNHPTLTENFLLIEVAVNHVHMTKCNCLTI